MKVGDVIICNKYDECVSTVNENEIKFLEYHGYNRDDLYTIKRRYPYTINKELSIGALCITPISLSDKDINKHEVEYTVSEQFFMEISEYREIKLNELLWYWNLN